MPILKNPKHELFAQAIVRGENGRTAYRETGFGGSDASADVAASRLIRNDKVSARVTELQGRQVAASGTVLSKVWVIEQTIALAKEARENGAYGPAAKCMELLAREVNAFVEKKEIGAPGDFDDAADAVLRNRLYDLSREIGGSVKNRRGIEEAADQGGMRDKPSQVH